MGLQGRCSDFYSRRDCAGIPPACSPFKLPVTREHLAFLYSVVLLRIVKRIAEACQDSCPTGGLFIDNLAKAKGYPAIIRGADQN